MPWHLDDFMICYIFSLTYKRTIIPKLSTIKVSSTFWHFDIRKFKVIYGRSAPEYYPISTGLAEAIIWWGGAEFPREGGVKRQWEKGPLPFQQHEVLLQESCSETTELCSHCICHIITSHQFKLSLSLCLFQHHL